jgi:hypothetical protein
MNVTSVSPSAEAKTILKALQQAVAKNLEKKQRLGQYAVMWQNGRSIQVGDDAPKGDIEDAKHSPVQGD